MRSNGANKKQLLLKLQGEQLTLILPISSYWGHSDNKQLGGWGVVIVLIFDQTHLSGTSTLLLSPFVRVRLGQGGSDI